MVFYSKGSGSTHLVTPVAAFILELLMTAPRSSGELLEEVSRQVDDMAAEDVQTVLGSLLEELQQSELIESV